MVQHYSHRALDDDMRSQMALDWIAREQVWMMMIVVMVMVLMMVMMILVIMMVMVVMMRI